MSLTRSSSLSNTCGERILCSMSLLPPQTAKDGLAPLRRSSAARESCRPVSAATSLSSIDFHPHVGADVPTQHATLLSAFGSGATGPVFPQQNTAADLPPLPISSVPSATASPVADKSSRHRDGSGARSDDTGRPPLASAVSSAISDSGSERCTEQLIDDVHRNDSSSDSGPLHEMSDVGEEQREFAAAHLAAFGVKAHEVCFDQFMLQNLMFFVGCLSI
jgi:hypothetical protein